MRTIMRGATKSPAVALVILDFLSPDNPPKRSRMEYLLVALSIAYGTTKTTLVETWLPVVLSVAVTTMV